MSNNATKSDSDPLECDDPTNLHLTNIHDGASIEKDLPMVVTTAMASHKNQVNRQYHQMETTYPRTYPQMYPSMHPPHPYCQGNQQMPYHTQIMPPNTPYLHPNMPPYTPYLHPNMPPYTPYLHPTVYPQMSSVYPGMSPPVPYTNRIMHHPAQYHSSFTTHAHFNYPNNLPYKTEPLSLSSNRNEDTLNNKKKLPVDSNGGEYFKMKTVNNKHNCATFPTPQYSLPTDMLLQMKHQTIQDSQWSYLCHFSSTTSMTVRGKPQETAEETAIIQIVHRQNMISRGRAVYRTKLYENSSIQWLKYAQCRGCKKVDKATCNLQFLWVRGKQVLGLYAKTQVGNNNAISNLKHCLGCRRTRAELPSSVVNAALQANPCRHGSRRLMSSVGLYKPLESESKKARKAVSDIMVGRNKICNQWNTNSHGETLQEFADSYTSYFMSIETFCDKIRDEAYVKDNLKKIVILNTDVNEKNGGRWEAVVFTTIGRGLTFLKVIEMYKAKKAITGQIDGTNILDGEDTIRSLIFGHSDFEHKFYDVLLSIVREEANEPSLMILDTAQKIYNILTKGSTKRFCLLKDGGVAFRNVAIQLKLEQRDCRVHKVERKDGTGTNGINGCGSIGKFLHKKQLKDKESSKFFTVLLNSLFAVSNEKVYLNAVLMLYKYMLSDWVASESKDQSKKLIEVDATLLDVQNKLESDFRPYESFVRSKEDSTSETTKGKKSSKKASVRSKEDSTSETTKGKKSSKKASDFTKLERVILWFSAFYFPYTKEEITYGPSHVPGEPDHTNGLESHNFFMQTTTKWCRIDFRTKNYGAYMKAAQETSNIPDEFRTTPIEKAEDWQEILDFGKKAKQGNTPLPSYLLYMVVYRLGGEARLVKRKDTTKAFETMAKNTGHVNHGLVIYLPTRHFLDIIIDEVKQEMLNSSNPHGYTLNGLDETRPLEKDAETLFQPVYRKLMEELKGM